MSVQESVVAPVVKQLPLASIPPADALAGSANMSFPNAGFPVATDVGIAATAPNAEAAMFWPVLEKANISTNVM